MSKDWSRIYARQEFMTPGEPATLRFLIEAAGGAETRLLEVAGGKGEAACRLAAEQQWQVTSVERHLPFITYTAEKVRDRGLTGRVAIVRADGRRLPLRDAAFDAGLCAGAPSIVGIEPCLSELSRCTRTGAAVVVSDIVWRRKPRTPLGPEWRWVAEETHHLSEGEYGALIEAAGLRVERAYIHPVADWEAYFAPMAATAAAERAAGDAAFAADIEDGLAVERRAVEAFFDYASFVARKP